MSERVNGMAAEVNGIHVLLTFSPFPDDDVFNRACTILKKRYVQTLEA